MCHTGHAYSRTGLTTLTYILTRSFCVIPERLCTNVYQPFSQYYPRVCSMSDPEKWLHLIVWLGKLMPYPSHQSLYSGYDKKIPLKLKSKVYNVII